MKYLLIILLIVIIPVLQAETTFSSKEIITNSTDIARLAHVIDMDGDHDIDIISFSGSNISWYENDGNQNYTTHTIATSNFYISDVYVIDIDGDNDIDIFSAVNDHDNTKDNSQVIWYENDGNQNFSTNVIANISAIVDSLYVIDMDEDNNIDIIMNASSTGEITSSSSKIFWYANDGNQNFSRNTIISREFVGSMIYAIDMDKDGDIDIISASSVAGYEGEHDNFIGIDSEIAWYENNGNQIFTTHTITTSADGINSIYAIDINGDSNVDILTSALIHEGEGDKVGNKITWYENNGSQKFTSHTIATSDNGFNSVYAIDIDEDGDIDIIPADNDKLIWYENDSRENFVAHEITTEGIIGVYDVYAADINGNGKIDIVASDFDKKIVLYENLALLVTDISAITKDGTYSNKDIIDITIQFSDVVNVTGTPQLTLETGATDAVVDYTSGSGTDTLIFTYTVASGETSADLDYISTTALALNGGTIKNATNDVDLTLPIPGTDNSLSDNKAIVVDATVPDVPTNLKNIGPTSQTQINLSWTDNSNNETGFKIERDNILIQTTTTDVTNYNDTVLTCGTTYNYSVIATNDNGDSDPISVNTSTLACSVTYNLTVSTTGNGTITDSYDINCDTNCEYEYIDQTVLYLTATPDIGWIFDKWSGDCDSNGEVQLNSDTSCSATFIKPNVETTVTDIINLTKGISNSGYGLWLNSPPITPVIITLNGKDGLILEPTILTFDDTNWNIQQIVKITVNNYLLEGLHENIISHTVISDDINYNNLSMTDITANIIKLVSQESLEDLPSLLEENLPEDVTLEDITTEPPEIVNTTGLPSNCNVRDDSNIISSICDVEQRVFPKKVEIISDTSSISNAVFEDDVSNGGMIANSTIGKDSILSGGTLSGNINNEGTIKDVKFVGNELNGGTLSGYVINGSKIGGIIKDVYLSIDTTLQGGKIYGIIIGEVTDIQDDIPVITGVKILSGTHLSNLHLSPTVELENNVIFEDNVTVATEPYTPLDFGLDAEDIASLTPELLYELEPEALATFTTEDVKNIPPEALSELQAVQIATMEGLEGLTEEQFTEIPIATFTGLTSDNMADFSVTTIKKFTPKHVTNLNRKSFRKMSSKRVSKLLVHFDSAQVSLKQAEELLPDDWELDMETGALTPPIGAKFTPPLLENKSSDQVSLPAIANIDAGVGVGGLGDNIKTDIEQSVEENDTTDFVLSQDDNGILNVGIINEDVEAQYAFILDTDNAIQVDTEEIPVGISIGLGGFYNITTPEGQQYRVIPAPKDPIALANTTGSKVALGMNGDVLMHPSNRTRSSDVYEVMIVDQSVEQGIDDLCVEIWPSKLECDDEDLRRSSRAKTRKIKYPDGTAQTVRPTVLSPDVFIEEALKIEGVKQVVYKADGTFAMLYQGKPYFIIPNFTVKNKLVSENVEPSIVFNGNDSITYNISIEVETDTRSSDVYEILSFEPFLEFAPEDLCIEIMPDEFECDF